MNDNTSGSPESVAKVTNDLEQFDREVAAATSALSEAKRRRKAAAAYLDVLTGTKLEGGGRNGVTKEDVIAAITEARTARPRLAGDELQETVKEALKKSGKSLTGMRLAYASALREVSEKVG